MYFLKNNVPGIKLLPLLFLIKFALAQFSYTEDFLNTLEGAGITMDNIVTREIEDHYKSLTPSLYVEVPYKFRAVSSSGEMEFRIMASSGKLRSSALLEADRIARAISPNPGSVTDLKQGELGIFNASAGVSVEASPLRPEFSTDYSSCMFYLIQQKSRGWFILYFLTNRIDDTINTQINSLKYWLFFQSEPPAKFAGIGVKIRYNLDYEVEIQGVMEDHGAAFAGLLPADIITRVDGIDITGMPLRKIVEMITGPEGTTVLLDIRREAAPLSLTVMRGDVDVSKATYLDPEPDKVVWGPQSTYLKEHPDCCQYIEDLTQGTQDLRYYRGKFLGSDAWGSETWMAGKMFPGADSGKFVRTIGFTESEKLQFVMFATESFDAARAYYDDIILGIDSCFGGMYIHSEKPVEDPLYRETFFQHALRGEGGSVDLLPVFRVSVQGTASGSSTVELYILFM